MDLTIALVLWLIAFVIVFFVARRYNVRMFSAITLALLIAIIVLSIAKPFNQLPMNMSSGLTNSLYWLILFISPLVFTVYIVWSAVTDTEVRPVGVTRI